MNLSSIPNERIRLAKQFSMVKYQHLEPIKLQMTHEGNGFNSTLEGFGLILVLLVPLIFQVVFPPTSQCLTVLNSYLFQVHYTTFI